MNRSKVV